MRALLFPLPLSPPKFTWWREGVKKSLEEKEGNYSPPPPLGVANHLLLAVTKRREARKKGIRQVLRTKFDKSSNNLGLLYCTAYGFWQFKKTTLNSFPSLSQGRRGVAYVPFLRRGRKFAALSLLSPSAAQQPQIPVMAF